MDTVKIETKNKTYEVYIKSGAINEAGSIAKKILGICRAAVITDDAVDALHASKLISSLEKEGFETVKYVFKNGEMSKNTNTYVAILDFLAANGITRKDAVFALGGGVTGDMAGFAAATFLRGVKLVQVPTTLLACVDSSVGGKTAVDLAYGKNLVGCFYQPDAVICDTDLLSTLSDDIFTDGCAEIIKYAAICDKELFCRLEKVIKNIDAGIIKRCIEIKRDVVHEDEYDKGLRQLLNFGHTFGHAIEKCSDFKLSHGKAVAAGMAIMARACAKNKICSDKCANELMELIAAFGFSLSTAYSADEIFSAVLSDKKRAGKDITLVVLEDKGKCALKTVSTQKAKEFLLSGIDK